MNTIRLLMLSVFLFAGVAAHAEQRVIMQAYQSTDGLDYTGNTYSAPISPPKQVVDLVTKGWRVTDVATSAGGASSSGYQRPYLVIFVLESPAPLTPSVDLKVIWQAVYDQHKLTYSSVIGNEKHARTFADRVVAAMTQETKP